MHVIIVQQESESSLFVKLVSPTLAKFIVLSHEFILKIFVKPRLLLLDFGCLKLLFSRLTSSSYLVTLKVLVESLRLDSRLLGYFFRCLTGVASVSGDLRVPIALLPSDGPAELRV